MSCFFVSEAVIDCAVSLVARMQDHFGASCVFPNNPCSRSAEACDRLGRELWAMNADAVALRYRLDWGNASADERAERAAMDRDAASYRHDHRTALDMPAAAMLKQLSCLIYQCEEFEGYNRPALLDLLCDAETRACGLIVSDLPDYRAAPWGVAERLAPPRRAAAASCLRG